MMDIQWAFGLSATGFIFLCSWIIKLQIEVGKKVSYDWIEQKFEKDIKEELKLVNTFLSDIREAIVGNMKEKGIISRLNDVEKDLEELKK